MKKSINKMEELKTKIKNLDQKRGEIKAQKKIVREELSILSQKSSVIKDDIKKCVQQYIEEFRSELLADTVHYKENHDLDITTQSRLMINSTYIDKFGRVKKNEYLMDQKAIIVCDKCWMATSVISKKQDTDTEELKNAAKEAYDNKLMHVVVKDIVITEFEQYHKDLKDSITVKDLCSFPKFFYCPHHSDDYKCTAEVCT